MYRGKYVTALIAAAGMGNRMCANVNKPYIYLNGKPVLTHTIEKFENCKLVDEIIIIAKEDELEFCRNRAVNNYNFKKVMKVIRGGKERQDSIYNGILALNNRTEIVISHDGARPFVTEEVIGLSIKEAYEKGAAVVGVPVTDTIKVTREGRVSKTPKRSSLWAAQTPQTFRKDILKEAYEKALDQGFLGTDDSSLVERLGFEVTMVEGEYSNIKLTTPEDLILAEALMENRFLMENKEIFVQTR